MSQPTLSMLLIGLMILVPIALVALGIFMAVSFQRSQRQLRDEYAAFAKRVNGQLVMAAEVLAVQRPREVRFLHGKHPCALLVDIEMIGGGEQNHHVYYMRLALDLGRPARFTCRVQPQWLPKFLAGALRTSDIRLGWDEFDRRFLVEASDELRAPDVLNLPVQQQLLAISQAAAAMSPLDGGHVTLQVHERWIEIRMKGFLDQDQQLWPLYQLGGRLFDLLSPRL